MPAKQKDPRAARIAERNARRAEYAGSPPDALFAQDAIAAVLDVEDRTLETWRRLGRGPAFVRVGRAARYRRKDVDQWIADGGALEGGE